MRVMRLMCHSCLTDFMPVLPCCYVSYLQVHCGFNRGGGAEMESKDIKYVERCRFVVASGIFDGYD